MPTLVRSAAATSLGLPDIKLRPGSASEQPAEAVQKQAQFAKNKDFTLRNIKKLVPALKGLVTASKPKLVEFRKLGGKLSSDPAAKELNKAIQSIMNTSLRNVKNHFLGNATVKAYLLEASPEQVRSVANIIKSATFSALGKHIDTAIKALRPDVDLAPVTVQLEALAIGSGEVPALEEKGQQESKVVTPPQSQRHIRRGNSGDSTASDSSASAKTPPPSRQRTDSEQAVAEKPAPLTPEQQFIESVMGQIVKALQHAVDVETKYFIPVRKNPSDPTACSNLSKALNKRLDQIHNSLQKAHDIPDTTDSKSILMIRALTEIIRRNKGSVDFTIDTTDHLQAAVETKQEEITPKIDMLIEEIETKFNFKLKPISIEE